MHFSFYVSGERYGASSFRKTLKLARISFHTAGIYRVVAVGKYCQFEERVEVTVVSKYIFSVNSVLPGLRCPGGGGFALGKSPYPRVTAVFSVEFAPQQSSVMSCLNMQMQCKQLWTEIPVKCCFISFSNTNKLEHKSTKTTDLGELNKVPSKRYRAPDLRDNSSHSTCHIVTA